MFVKASKKLILFVSELQESLSRPITNYILMADVLYIYWHVKFAKSSVLVKQLTDLDFLGTTIKRVIGNFGRVKRCLQYFLIKKHKRFFENIDNCLIDKIHSSDTKKIEYYWMRRFKTLTSSTFNRKEKYWRYSFSSITSTYIWLKFLNLLFKLLFVCKLRRLVYLVWNNVKFLTYLLS